MQQVDENDAENVQEFKQQEIASLKNEIKIMPDLKQWDKAI